MKRSFIERSTYHRFSVFDLHFQVRMGLCKPVKIHTLGALWLLWVPRFTR